MNIYIYIYIYIYICICICICVCVCVCYIYLFIVIYLYFCMSTVSSVDEYDYTTSERGPTYEYEEKVRTNSDTKYHI